MIFWIPCRRESFPNQETSDFARVSQTAISVRLCACRQTVPTQETSNTTTGPAMIFWVAADVDDEDALSVDTRRCLYVIFIALIRFIALISRHDGCAPPRRTRPIEGRQRQRQRYPVDPACRRRASTRSSVLGRLRPAGRELFTARTGRERRAHGHEYATRRRRNARPQTCADLSNFNPPLRLQTAAPTR